MDKSCFHFVDLRIPSKRKLVTTFNTSLKDEKTNKRDWQITLVLIKIMKQRAFLHLKIIVINGKNQKTAFIVHTVLAS